MTPDAWTQIEPLYTQLANTKWDGGGEDALEQWILKWDELSTVIGEESSRRYITMTCDTADKEAEKRYLEFLESIEPEVKKQNFMLAKLFVNHPERHRLEARRYAEFDRHTALEVELFCPENVALETEASRLGQQYQKLTGGLAVEFDGREQTLVQMGRYQEENDRNLRRAAWEKVAERRLQESEKIDALFDEMAEHRQAMAENADFPDFRDFAHKKRARFDYTPNDCLAFQDAIEEEIVPLLKELQVDRKNKLGLDTLRPWDTSADPLGRPPLKPFEQVDEMIARTQAIFDQLDGELAGWFRSMQDFKLLDLGNRKGKAPGGYQDTLAEARLPFIFMNAIGVQRDVETLLHEAGHAFHTMACQEEPLNFYRHAPIEFCEVASMSMELIGNGHIGEFYNDADSRRARLTHLEGIVSVFPWIATVDAFQHWLYTHPGHSVADRDAKWNQLMDRFGGIVDWNGHESARTKFWHKQLHIFLVPFYYIEYGIAQLGALQVWNNSQDDPAEALANYKASLALGGSRPLPELFDRCGIHLDFSQETVRPMAGFLRREIDALKNRDE